MFCLLLFIFNVGLFGFGEGVCFGGGVVVFFGLFEMFCVIGFG